MPTRSADYNNYVAERLADDIGSDIIACRPFDWSLKQFQNGHYQHPALRAALDREDDPPSERWRKTLDAHDEALERAWREVDAVDWRDARDWHIERYARIEDAFPFARRPALRRVFQGRSREEAGAMSATRARAANKSAKKKVAAKKCEDCEKKKKCDAKLPEDPTSAKGRADDLRRGGGATSSAAEFEAVASVMHNRVGQRDFGNAKDLDGVLSKTYYDRRSGRA